MSIPTAYHQIGQFIISFQRAETALTELLVLMADADDEAIQILVSELGYAQRVKTTNILFARFADMQPAVDIAAKTDFRRLIIELGKLGERRNDLLHSKRRSWLNVEVATSVIRENPELRIDKEAHEHQEEELLLEDFSADLGRLLSALQEIERFRLKIIDWLCPDRHA